MKTMLCIAAAAAAIALAGRADAATIPFTFSGPGVSGSLMITYGPATDAKYSNGFEITSVTGTFTDTNNAIGTGTPLNIVDAPITGLATVNHATPDSTNHLAPADFSKFAVAANLPSMSNGAVTYDNLFWPSGAPATASDFDGAGGFLDIYGLMFTVGGSTMVDLFNNGVGAFSGINYGGYGVVVANSATALDYVSGGVSVTAPEPSTWAMMVLGFGSLAFAGYRASRKVAPAAA
jgi:hypothetical protein